jgi:hypothetical protein
MPEILKQSIARGEQAWNFLVDKNLLFHGMGIGILALLVKDKAVSL